MLEVLSSITNRKELLATFFLSVDDLVYLQGKIKPALIFKVSVDEQGRSVALPMGQGTLSRPYIHVRSRDSEPSFFLGRILREQGRHSEAIAYLRQALRLAPRFGSTPPRLSVV